MVAAATLRSKPCCHAMPPASRRSAVERRITGITSTIFGTMLGIPQFKLGGGTLGRALLAAMIAVGLHAEENPLDLPRLMQIMAGAETREAAFIERKTMSLLAQPLVSSGILRYRRPEYVERMTTTPSQERFVYDNGQITIEADGRERKIQAKDQPSLVALIESIRATLAGDEASLRRHFELRLTGTRVNWLLEMTPRHETLGERVAHIRVSGRDDQLRQFEIKEVSGDQTLMTISPLRR